MSSIELYINGNTVQSHTVDFPDSVVNIFHYSLFNLNSRMNLISQENLKKRSNYFNMGSALHLC